MEELFNKWLESKDTTENIINHLKGQKSFPLDFLKYVTEQCNIPAVVSQREQLKAFADFIQSDTSHMNYDFKDLVEEYLESL